jgi:hypothetical protein
MQPAGPGKPRKRDEGKAVRTSYDEDFAQWTEETASALREGRFEGLDWRHIAEEIESLGATERRALANRLKVLVQHLLKWQRQPGRRSNSWRAATLDQRVQIAAMLEEMPSLQRLIEPYVAKRYRVARLAASGETGLPESAFPPECPYTVEQMLDQDFLPE